MIAVIIDDGVSTHTTNNLIFSLQVDEHEMINSSTGYTDALSHGSICAAIIQKYAPHALIGSIKILDSETKRGDCTNLERAIYWCIDHDIKIIHLSLGTVSVYDYPSLLKAINNAYEHGIIIISACKNGSPTSYPAAFSNVIGVQCDSTLKNDAYYAREPNYHGIDFSASAVHEIKEFISTPFQGLTPICNSYAAPVITAKVYSILVEHPYMTFDQIKKELNKTSKLVIPSYHPMIYKHIDWVDHVKLLVFGNPPVSPRSMHYWNINEIISLESDLVLQDILLSSLDDLPLAISISSPLDTKKSIPIKTRPLVFLNRLNVQDWKQHATRIFIPTLIDDYATNQRIHNERPVVAILQDTLLSDFPLSAVLKEMFNQKDYYTLFFSEYPIDTLVGAVYIDNTEFYQYHCMNMAQLLNAELLLVHTTLENLHILQPDIILYDKTCKNSLLKIPKDNAHIIFTDHRDPTEIFQIICDIICE